MSAAVSQPIRIHFEAAKKLDLYAWFVIRFYPVAELLALTTLEFTLRERLKDRFDSEVRPPSLGELLRMAAKHGLISNEAFGDREAWALQRARSRASFEQVRFMSQHGLTELAYDETQVEPTDEDRATDWLAELLELIPTIRNDYAHGSAMLHPSVLRTFGIVRDLVNYLFQKDFPEFEQK